MNRTGRWRPQAPGWRGRRVDSSAPGFACLAVAVALGACGDPDRVGPVDVVDATARPDAAETLIIPDYLPWESDCDPARTVFGALRFDDPRAAVDGLAGVECVYGDLAIVGAYDPSQVTVSLSLPSLREVWGDLEISSVYTANAIELPALALVAGDLSVFANARVGDLFVGPDLVAVGGDVRVSSNGSLVNLIGFESLRFVTGTLAITDNAALRGLDAFHTLEDAVGDVVLSGNHQLKTIDAFTALTRVGGALTVHGNLLPTPAFGRLTAVDGRLWLSGIPHGALTFPALTDVGDDLLVTNAALTDLGLLPVLARVGGDLRLEANEVLRTLGALSRITSLGTLTIGACPALDSLDGLQQLTRLDGLRLRSSPIASLAPLRGVAGALDALELYEVPIASLDGLQGVTAVDSLALHRLPNLTSLDALADMAPFEGDLLVTDCGALTSLDGLPFAPTLAQINVGRAQRLADLGELGGLTWVEGNLSIYQLPALADLRDLGSLVGVDGGLTLQDLDVTNLQGLAALESVGAPINLRRLARVTSLAGLENLHDIDDNIVVSDCPLLEQVGALARALPSARVLSLQSLPKLTSLADLAGVTALGGLQLFRCDALTDLAGLDDVTSITNNFSVDDCDGITSLDGLGALTSVGSSVSVNNNPALRRVDLPRLTTLGTAAAPGSLSLRENRALPDCLADALRDQLADAGWQGQSFVANNREGCTCAPARDGGLDATCP